MIFSPRTQACNRKNIQIINNRLAFNQHVKYVFSLCFRRAFVRNQGHVISAVANGQFVGEVSPTSRHIWAVVVMPNFSRCIDDKTSLRKDYVRMVFRFTARVPDPRSGTQGVHGAVVTFWNLKRSNAEIIEMNSTRGELYTDHIIARVESHSG